MKHLKATSIAALLVALLSTGAAQAADEDDISSAPESLTRSHAAQLNVSALDGPVDKLTEPCEAELRFVDENGRTFSGSNGQPVAASVSLWPGQARSLTLPAGVAFLDGTQNSRAIFRARITLAEPADDASFIDPCEGLLAAVETYDTRSGESLKLQMVMDRKSRMLTVLSNIMKKIQGTTQTILDNLK